MQRCRIGCHSLFSLSARHSFCSHLCTRLDAISRLVNSHAETHALERDTGMLRSIFCYCRLLRQHIFDMCVFPRISGRHPQSDPGFSEIAPCWCFLFCLRASGGTARRPPPGLRIRQWCASAEAAALSHRPYFSSPSSWRRDRLLPGSRTHALGSGLFSLGGGVKAKQPGGGF